MSENMSIKEISDKYWKLAESILGFDDDIDSYNLLFNDDSEEKLLTDYSLKTENSALNLEIMDLFKDRSKTGLINLPDELMIEINNKLLAEDFEDALAIINEAIEKYGHFRELSDLKEILEKKSIVSQKLFRKPELFIFSDNSNEKDDTKSFSCSDDLSISEFNEESAQSINNESFAKKGSVFSLESNNLTTKEEETEYSMTSINDTAQLSNLKSSKFSLSATVLTDEDEDDDDDSIIITDKSFIYSNTNNNTLIKEKMIKSDFKIKSKSINELAETGGNDEDNISNSDEDSAEDDDDDTSTDSDASDDENIDSEENVENDQTREDNKNNLYLKSLSESEEQTEKNESQSYSEFKSVTVENNDKEDEKTTEVDLTNEIENSEGTEDDGETVDDEENENEDDKNQDDDDYDEDSNSEDEDDEDDEEEEEEDEEEDDSDDDEEDSNNDDDDSDDGNEIKKKESIILDMNKNKSPKFINDSIIPNKRNKNQSIKVVKISG